LEKSLFGKEPFFFPSAADRKGSLQHIGLFNKNRGGNMMSTSFPSEPWVLPLLFLSNDPQETATFVTTAHLPYLPPIEIPVEVQAITPDEEEEPFHRFLLVFSDVPKKIVFPRTIEEVYPGLISHILQNDRIGLRPHIFSREILIQHLLHTQDPQEALETLAPQLPPSELQRLIVAIQTIFTERILLFDGKKRGFIRCVRSSLSTSFVHSHPNLPASPSQLKIFCCTLPEGKSGLYSYGNTPTCGGETIMQPISSPLEPPSSALCMIKNYDEEHPESHDLEILAQEYTASVHLHRNQIPFILKIWGIDYFKKKESPPYRRIIAEYCDKGPLPVFIAAEPNLLKRMPLGLQLAESLATMHSKGIFHMNLLPENILVRSAPEGVVLRLRNFSTLQTRSLKKQNTVLLSTITYPPPEMIDHHTYKRPIPLTEGADLWNLGNILFFLKFGICPFQIASPMFTGHTHCFFWIK
jgi:hypothetical protein